MEMLQEMSETELDASQVCTGCRHFGGINSATGRPVCGINRNWRECRIRIRPDEGMTLAAVTVIAAIIACGAILVLFARSAVNRNNTMQRIGVQYVR